MSMHEAESKAIVINNVMLKSSEAKYGAFIISEDCSMSQSKYIWAE
jgi:hypothetical protein